MILISLEGGRLLALADVHHMGATRVESTPGWRVKIAGYATRNAGRDATASQLGHRLHQTLGVRVEGS